MLAVLDSPGEANLSLIRSSVSLCATIALLHASFSSTSATAISTSKYRSTDTATLKACGDKRSGKSGGDCSGVQAQLVEMQTLKKVLAKTRFAKDPNNAVIQKAEERHFEVAENTDMASVAANGRPNVGVECTTTRSKTEEQSLTSTSTSTCKKLNQTKRNED